jgi:misacylated tRNA(Ala) deacylase
MLTCATDYFFIFKNHQKIDMAKSYAPRMHSAEHILNQVMVRKFNCGRCFSAHVNKKKSKCDYHFDRALTDDEVTEIEASVNKVIFAILDVTEEMVSLEVANRNFNLTRLPDGIETVRIVNIGDYDSCPCIGEHVDNTYEIFVFHIISQGFNDGVLRIRYKLDDPK